MGDDGSTWADSLKNHAVWFVFAIILTAGTSWVNTRLYVESLDQRVSDTEEKVERLRQHIETNERKINDLRERLTRLEQKIDVVLQNQGVRPGDYDFRMENVERNDQ